MKAILEFELPEENTEFSMCTYASDLAVLISDIDNHCRSEMRYNDKLTEESYNELENIRNMIYESQYTLITGL